MSSIKNIITISLLNIKKWRSNYRMWFIAAYIVYFVYFITQNVPTGVAEKGIKISCWLQPFLMSNWSITLLFLCIPLVILFCDAPFLDDTQPYIVVRSKRLVWVLGQILYVIIAAFIYVFSIFALTVIENIGVIEFTSSWGTFMESPDANQMLAVNPQGYLFINDYVLDNFSPMQATWFSFLYFWLAAIFIGLLMFCLNSVTNTRIVGGVCAAFVILVGFLGTDNIYFNFTWVSPVTWVDISFIDIGGQTEYPSFTYTMIFYAAAFALLLAVILIHNRKRTIEVLPPV